VDLDNIQSLVNVGDYHSAIQQLSTDQVDGSLEGMVLKSQILRELGHTNQALITAQQSTDKAKQEKSKYFEFRGIVEQIYCQWVQGDYEIVLKKIRQTRKKLPNNKLPELQNVELIAKLDHLRANLHWSLGEVDDALTIHKKNEKRFLELKDNKFVGLVLNNMGVLYFLKGQIDKSLAYYEESLFFNRNYKLDRARTLTNMAQIYRIKNDYDDAKLNALESLEILETYLPSNYEEISSSLFELIFTLVQNKEIDESIIYCEMLEAVDERSDSDIVSLRKDLSQAIVKKQSPRLKNRFAAQLTLEKIINNEIIRKDYTLLAMYSLFDLLLDEMQLSGREEIIDELNELVQTLKEESKLQFSQLLLAESYYLEAKICLLSLDFQKSRRLLSQALLICEENGLTGLEIEFNVFFDELVRFESSVNERSPGEISLVERIEKSKTGKLAYDLENPKYSPIQVAEENPVMALIVTQSGNVLFFENFQEHNGVNEHLIGSFLSAVSSFSQQTFEEAGKLEIIQTGDFSILLHYIFNVILVYIFRGNSHYARRKMKEWAISLSSDKIVQDVLNQDVVLQITNEVVTKLSEITSNFFLHSQGPDTN
jgi:tetratricopeptide (TPR) repeat protein